MTGVGPGYGSFLREVARAQVQAWLPEPPAYLLDLSGGAGEYAPLAVARGLQVVHALGGPGDRQQPSPRVLPVVAETVDLGWLADGSVDAVLAEGQALSFCPATELTVDHIYRVLRPGGRLLLSVDSLVLGLARLADQGRWAELSDAPHADVVLVPEDDGTVTRCFWPEQLREMLEQSGFQVDWVRPRTVLSPEAVERALRNDRSTLATLVATELELAREREGDAHGAHLVAGAVRR